MTRAALLATVVLLGVAPGAAAQVPYVNAVDLLTEAPVQIDGSVAGELSGVSMAGDLDFNDDGRRDVVVGSPSRTGSPVVWVVLGEPGPLVDLATAGAGAVRISGIAGELTGNSVSRAGDFNGDGIDDLVIGARFASPGGRAAAGTAYVVFGRTGTSPIDLANPGFGGVVLEGGTAGDTAGESVSDAGNVNGDEYDDVIVGAPGRDDNGRTDSGTAYVVFGAAAGGTLNLATLGGRGYPIAGDDDGDWAGYAVANAGLVSGDSFPDQLIGAPYATVGANASAGKAYVVSGKVNTTPVDLRALGAAGYRIDGEAASDATGSAVANAGDVNGDQRPDHLIGAPYANPGLEGAAYVVHAKTGSASLSVTTAPGYEIIGASADDWTGTEVAGLGDVSGDFRADQLVMAPGSDQGGRTDAGAGHVVHGSSGSYDIDLGYVASQGYRIDGASAGDGLRGAAGVGHVGGTNARDVAVGAPSASANGRAGSGSSYVVYGEQAAFYALATLRLSRSIVWIRPSLAAAPAQADDGIVIRYGNRVPMRVRLRVLQQVRGRTVRDRPSEAHPLGRVRCVPGAARRVRGRRSAVRSCDRRVVRGRLARVHRAPGEQSLRFTGRLPNGTLPPGAYVLELTGQDRSGRRYGPTYARFRVRKR